MRIRKMTIDDYENVYGLWVDTPGMGLNTIDDSKAGFYKFLQRNPISCFVAENDNEIIGSILSGHDGRRGLIYHLAVRVADRTKGVGSALVDCALDALKSEGIAKVYITIYKNNDDGNAFWEKRGFTIPESTIYRAKEIITLEHLEI